MKGKACKEAKNLCVCCHIYKSSNNEEKKNKLVFLSVDDQYNTCSTAKAWIGNRQ